MWSCCYRIFGLKYSKIIFVYLVPILLSDPEFRELDPVVYTNLVFFENELKSSNKEKCFA